MSIYSLIFINNDNYNKSLEYRSIKEWWEQLSGEQVCLELRDNQNLARETSDAFTIKNTQLLNNILYWSIDFNSYRLEAVGLELDTKGGVLQAYPVESEEEKCCFLVVF